MLLLSYKVVTKDRSIPEKPTHHMLLLSFVIILQNVTKDHSIAGNQRIHATIFCNHLEKCYKRS
jgi:kynurenine formamidase